ncbi:hypothetical protein HMPREF1222_00088 [Treponema vincentii F0403]|uniref:DUF4349 domain-containing protein n=1 Tax=Treponema vincentii F0403 TaxID=1125702 RepID=S3LBK4_9SPIR|nr:DUF4349 domain-containing protein [Treponema vincentii]EPF47828.1 hypothetical protein HMPREF1222_00088 [Treponema vincentii F0403]
MKRHCIFQLFFILLAGITLCSSCAKNAAEQKALARTSFAQRTEAAKNILSEEEAAADTAYMEDNALADMQPSGSDVILERQLIKEGSINFETSDITETRQHIETLVQKYKAYISQEDERTTASRIYQDITVRIPKTHFDSFLSELSGDIKKFDNKSVTVQDVTEEFVDITARLSVKKETEQGYLRLLNQAKTIKDILDIQNELQDIRSDIESIEGRLRYLKNSVNFSTLHISMYQQIEAASEAGAFFMPVWDAIKGGVQAFAAVCIALLYGWVFIALGIAAMLIILRLRKRRRKAG